jgi:hypothetical protein
MFRSFLVSGEKKGIKNTRGRFQATKKESFDGNRILVLFKLFFETKKKKGCDRKGGMGFKVESELKAENEVYDDWVNWYSCNEKRKKRKLFSDFIDDFQSRNVTQISPDVIFKPRHLPSLPKKKQTINETRTFFLDSKLVRSLLFQVSSRLFFHEIS